MKRTIAIALSALTCFCGIICLSASPASAQTTQPTTQPTPMHRQGPLINIRRALQDLNLTQDQKNQIRTIFQQAMSDGQALRQTLQNATPQERQQKVHDFFDGVKQKVEAVLTADQVTQFERKLQTMHGQGAVAGGRNLIQNFRTAISQLDLTDDQRNKIDLVFQDVQSKAQELKDQPQDQRRTQMQQIMQDARQEIAGILTPDQMKTLHEKMQGLRGNTAPTTAPSV